MAYNTMPDYSAVLPGIQNNYAQNNSLQNGQYQQATNSLYKPLDFSGLSPIASPADNTGRNQMSDAVYNQQTRYLDPMYNNMRSDLDSRLANQGIMAGSEAYNREYNNFDMQKQAAYGDARDRAIQQGGAEQSRMSDLSMSQRNQGINELLAQRNAPLQSLQALSGINAGNTNGLFGIANSNYQANLGNQNASAAQNANFNNGLFSLGSTLLQNPDLLKSGINYLSGLFA